MPDNLFFISETYENFKVDILIQFRKSIDIIIFLYISLLLVEKSLCGNPEIISRTIRGCTQNLICKIYL